MTSYDAGPLDRLRAATPATLTVTYETDGAPADPGTVTITVRDPDGVALHTNAPTTGTGTAARRFDLAAEDTAALGNLAITWQSGTLGPIAATAEVVGGQLFTVAEARRFDKHQLADEDDYPDALILEAHDRIAEDFERILRVPPFPVRKVTTLDGQEDAELHLLDYRPLAPPSRELVLPGVRCIDLLRVEIRTPGTRTWVALDGAALADTILTGDGRLVRDTAYGWPPGIGNVRATYTQGYPVAPRALGLAALTVLIATIVPSNVSDRATMEIENGMTYRLSTADGERNRWYGLPQVDAALARYRLPNFGIG